MDSIISTFHIDVKTLITQAVNFSIVLVVLYMFALKPIQKIMRERTAKIEKGIEDAKKNEEMLRKSKEDYDQSMAKAKAEANDLLKDMKKEVSEKRSAMLEDAKTEVAAAIAAGKQSLESEKQKMLSDAKKELAALAIQVTEKVLGEKVDASYQEKAAKEVSKI